MISLTFDAESHEYRNRGQRVMSVTQAIAGAGLVDDRWFDDYSRYRGTAVHLACEFWDQGKLDEDALDPVIVPYLDGWKLFTAETGAKWDDDGIEMRVFDAVNGYAGTLDRLGYVNGRRTLADIKTGAGDYPRTALQLAAYLHATGEICDRMAVQLPGDGKYKIHLYKIEHQIRDFHVFAAALVVAKFKEGYR